MVAVAIACRGARRLLRQWPLVVTWTPFILANLIVAHVNRVLVALYALVVVSLALVLVVIKHSPLLLWNMSSL